MGRKTALSWVVNSPGDELWVIQKQR
jgi:hypothetical protein